MPITPAPGNALNSKTIRLKRTAINENKYIQTDGQETFWGMQDGPIH